MARRQFRLVRSSVGWMLSAWLRTSDTERTWGLLLRLQWQRGAASLSLQLVPVQL